MKTDLTCIRVFPSDSLILPTIPDTEGFSGDDLDDAGSWMIFAHHKSIVQSDHVVDMGISDVFSDVLLEYFMVGAIVGEDVIPDFPRQTHHHESCHKRTFE